MVEHHSRALATFDDVVAMRNRLVGDSSPRMMRDLGRRQAIADLAMTACSLFHENTEIEKTAAFLRGQAAEARARVVFLEAEIARTDRRFGDLVAESGRARSKDDPAPLGDEPGLWLGDEPKWIDPGAAAQFTFVPVIPVLATHLAVAPMALGALAGMRITSIKCALMEYILQSRGAIPASLYAVRFPADSTEPVERGGRLPEDVRLYVEIPMVVVVRNEGPARALCECVVFGRKMDSRKSCESPMERLATAYDIAGAAAEGRAKGARRKPRSALD